jgi:hypothetical protein
MATERPSLPAAWRPALARCGAAAGGVALFVFTAALLFSATRPNHDVRLYARYARAWAAAGLPGLYQAYDVEYPHVAVGLMIAAHQLGTLIPAAQTPPRDTGPPPGPGDDGSFPSAYRWPRIVWCSPCCWR